MTDYLETPQGRRIAYESQSGQGPGVVFLGGFKSDMRGSKAEYLADWAARNDRAQAERGRSRLRVTASSASTALSCATESISNC